MVTDDFLSATIDFNLLSLRDLLAARELFHLHLINKPNVIATAVGRYRIRKTDPWADRQNPTGTPPSNRRQAPRTLANSEVRPYSWPAIFVFVERWMQTDDLENPQDAVPPAVYMPNGQKVPLCVVEAERREIRPEDDANYNFPASTIGGGYPVVCDVQGQEHIASVACLVTDEQVLCPHQSPRRRRGRIPILAIMGRIKSGSARAQSCNSAGCCSSNSIPPGQARMCLSISTSASSTSTTSTSGRRRCTALERSVRLRT